jgi:hypothetical protein
LCAQRADAVQAAATLKTTRSYNELSRQYRAGPQPALRGSQAAKADEGRRRTRPATRLRDIRMQDLDQHFVRETGLHERRELQLGPGPFEPIGEDGGVVEARLTRTSPETDRPWGTTVRQ